MIKQRTFPVIKNVPENVHIAQKNNIPDGDLKSDRRFKHPSAMK
jgi:hypothetical protein